MAVDRCDFTTDDNGGLIGIRNVNVADGWLRDSRFGAQALACARLREETSRGLRSVDVSAALEVQYHHGTLGSHEELVSALLSQERPALETLVFDAWALATTVADGAHLRAAWPEVTYSAEIAFGSMSELWRIAPKLRQLVMPVIGSNSLALGTIDAPELELLCLGQPRGALEALVSANLPKLRTLRLSFVRAADELVPKILANPTLTALEHLSLVCCDDALVWLRELIDRGFSARLKTLDLCSRNAENETWGFLSKSRDKFPGLQALWVDERLRAEVEGPLAESGLPLAWVKTIARVSPKNRQPPRPAPTAPRDLIDTQAKDRAREAALALVFRAPDDPASRRVCGDKLMELGDPRGELIALQLLAAPEEAQQKRIASLIRKHARDFAGPLYGVLEPKETRWDAGFLDELTLGQVKPDRLSDWTPVQQASEWRTVRKLVIQPRTPGEWLSKWLSSELSENLRVLDLRGAGSEGLAMRFEREPRGPWKIRSYHRSHWKLPSVLVAFTVEELRSLVTDVESFDIDARDLERIETELAHRARYEAPVAGSERAATLALWNAAWDGASVEAVSLALRQGACTEVVDEKAAHSPLSIAALRGYVEIVRVLIDAKARLDGPGPDAPAQYAVRRPIRHCDFDDGRPMPVEQDWQISEPGRFTPAPKSPMVVVARRLLEEMSGRGIVGTSQVNADPFLRHLVRIMDLLLDAGAPRPPDNHHAMVLRVAREVGLEGKVPPDWV